MNIEDISRDDLALISAVLHEAVADERYRHLDIPLTVMVRRIYERLAKGEQDPEKLTAAALGAYVVVPFKPRQRSSYGSSHRA